MSGGSTDTLLTIDDVAVHFDKEKSVLDLFSETQTIRAVDGVSFDIAENDVIALVGESGCGKTTLGKTVIGVQRPTSGSVKYRGQDIWDAKDNPRSSQIPHKDIRRALQIVHQDPGSSLNPYRKVEAILSEPLRKWQDISVEDRIARIHTMLETVGMEPAEDFARRYPHQLSGGEKQRVALVRTLLMNPDLILADESISALDVSLRVEMMDLMLELQEMVDTSYLFISHDLSNARYITEKAGGRIGIMYLGKIVEIGPPSEIIHNPQHPYTKALRWATPALRPDDSTPDELPLETIDVPDPTDPPSGCRFHTRCPEARAVCQRESPSEFSVENDTTHWATCYRVLNEHEYWNSTELEHEPLEQ